MTQHKNMTESVVTARGWLPVLQWIDFFRLIGVSLAYAVLARLVLAFSIVDGNATIFWIPGGLALAALMAWGLRLWPAVFFGALASGILVGDPFWVSAFLALGNVLESLAGAALLKRHPWFNSELAGAGDFLKLALVAAISASISALIGPITLLAGGQLPMQDAIHAVLRWWQADALGIILGTPFFLAWRTWPSGWFARKKVPATLALFLLAFLVGQVVFLGWFHDEGDKAPAYWMFPFVVCAAVSHGRHGALLIIAMTAVQALLGAAMGIGYFGEDFLQTGLQNFWIYILVLTLVGITLALNIEARQEAVQELRRTEERFRIMSNLLPDQIWTAQADGRLDYVNQSAVDFFGLPREAILRGGYEAVTHPEDLPNFSQWWSASLQADQPHELECRFRHHSGEYRWFIVSAMPFRDETGSIVKWKGKATDIDERKRSEALNKKLAAIIEASSDLIATSTPEGHVDYMNLAGRSLLGIGATEPLLQTWIRDYHPAWAYQRVAEEAIPAALAQGQWLGDNAMLRRDGSVLPVSQLVIAQRDQETGQIEFISTICRDISERLETEAKIRDLQLEQELILDAAPAMIWYKDTHNRILRVNAAAAESLGLRKDQVEGRPTADFYPEEAERYHQDDLAVARSGQPRLGIEEPYRLPSGETRWILTNKVPLQDEAGQVSRILVVSVDITERMRIEKALREADRQKDEFLAILAHELRNPLAAISAGVQIIHRTTDKPQAMCRTLAMMEGQLLDMVRILDDLLDIIRVNRGEIELRKEPANLADIVRRAVEICQPLMAQYGHEFAIDISPEPLRVEADLTRLTQVFANLLNNAAKFTPTGGRISINVEGQGREALVRVRDNGIGIPPDMLDSIFGMFYQIDASTQKLHGGLGIGLNLAKRLVELHGGAIEARSEGLGKGSEFNVRLPRLEAASPDPASPPPMEEAATPMPRRVMVVDDRVEIADATALLLQCLGHEVKIARDGPGAIAMAAEFRPELVLLDIGMPGMSGYEVCRRIRAEPWGRRIVVAALTGWGQPADKKLAEEAGFDHHLVKPLDLNVLEDILEGMTGHG